MLHETYFYAQEIALLLNVITFLPVRKTLIPENLKLITTYFDCIRMVQKVLHAFITVDLLIRVRR
jgi:hypothetical protein